MSVRRRMVDKTEKRRGGRWRVAHIGGDTAGVPGVLLRAIACVTDRACRETGPLRSAESLSVCRAQPGLVARGRKSESRGIMLVLVILNVRFLRSGQDFDG